MARKTKDFGMIFNDAYTELRKIKSTVTRDIYHYLCVKAEYIRNSVSLTKGNREELRRELGINASQLSVGLKELVNLKLVMESGGNYYINPLYFWKGKTERRRKLLDGLRDEHLKGNDISFMDIFVNPDYFTYL